MVVFRLPSPSKIMQGFSIGITTLSLYSYNQLKHINKLNMLFSKCIFMNHQCTKGFWSRLFSSFCFGFKTEIDWCVFWSRLSPKAIKTLFYLRCRGTEVIEVLYCLGYARTETIATFKISQQHWNGGECF